MRRNPRPLLGEGDASRRSVTASNSGHMAPISDMISIVTKMSPTLKKVLTSAAQLQVTVPDAVLVGGSAAALHAGHRDSFDHDHVLADLIDRYETVLDAVEATEGWATSVRASRDPDVIKELSRYKGLDKRWHCWDAVVGETRELALRLSGAA